MTLTRDNNITTGKIYQVLLLIVLMEIYSYQFHELFIVAVSDDWIRFMISLFWRRNVKAITLERLFRFGYVCTGFMLSYNTCFVKLLMVGIPMRFHGF